MRKIAALYDGGLAAPSTFELDEVRTRIFGMAQDYFPDWHPLICFGQTPACSRCMAPKSTFSAFGERGLQPIESVADSCGSSIQNPATAVFNRRCFELRIMEEVELARRYGRHGSVRGLE